MPLQLGASPALAEVCFPASQHPYWVTPVPGKPIPLPGLQGHPHTYGAHADTHFLTSTHKQKYINLF